MKSIAVFLALAFGAMRIEGQSETCCRTDADCMGALNEAQAEYNELYDKVVICDLECAVSSLVNCNMFGICESCRGCFMTCDGASRFMEETNALKDTINFCPLGEVEVLDDCYSAPQSGSGGVSGSGSSSAASGSGSGSGSRSGSLSGSGFGSGSRSSSSSGTMSGSSFGYGSASGDITAGSGSGSASSGGSSSISGSASTEGSREADIPGCTCGDAELDPADKDFFCLAGKSMYCDVECVTGTNTTDILFPEVAGLWCQPYGWDGCRLCRLDCSSYEGSYCVPCPSGSRDFCT